MPPALLVPRLCLICDLIVGTFRSQSSWLWVPEGPKAGAGPLMGGTISQDGLLWGWGPGGRLGCGLVVMGL